MVSMVSEDKAKQSSNAGSQTPERREKWYLRWWAVLVLLLTLGPFAFPALWKSKDINLFWKWFCTLAISILTILLTWGTWKTIQVLLNQFREIGF